jgi:hypothetical protein
VHARDGHADCGCVALKHVDLLSSCRTWMELIGSARRVAGETRKAWREHDCYEG